MGSSRLPPKKEKKKKEKKKKGCLTNFYTKKKSAQDLKGFLKDVFNGSYGAFTLDVESMLNENLGGILGGTQC
jgi:hypothetical protein